MRSSVLVCALLSFTAASAGPLLGKRQEGGTTTVGTGDGADTTTTVADGGASITTTTTSPAGSSPSPPTTIPPAEDDCPPCTEEGYRTHTSPSGKTCICLDGSTEPWSWADKKCINDYVGLPNDEGRPYFCLGSGDSPSSRACLSNCNFMLNTINSLNPCNPNLYNAARSCATCVPGGAIHYQVDGKSPGGPYINDESSMNTFMDGLKNWCALPSRCLDLSTGDRISGTGGCPVVAQSSPRGGSSTVRSDGTGSTGSSRNTGTPVPSRIVTTSTISTTDAQGRPTFSIELATVDNPEFTGNTAFAGARPSAGGQGAALSRRKLYTSSVYVLAMLTCFLIV